MATRAEWIEGMRLYALPLMASSAFVGTAVAISHGYVHPWRAVLVVFVVVIMQLGANLSNDYSDGIRGTDEIRVGPQRLVGSGAVAPRTMKLFAMICYGIGAVAALVLIALTRQPWIIAVGVVAIVVAIMACWFYTGGKHPYGYVGLGDLFVFICFGPLAVPAAAVTQQGHLDWTTVVACIAPGLSGCTVLMANNLRDLPTDLQSGKRTWATIIGDTWSRRAFITRNVFAVVFTVATAALTSWWALLGLAMLWWTVPAVRNVARGGTGMALVPVLKQVSKAQLASGIGILVGVIIHALLIR